MSALDKDEITDPLVEECKLNLNELGKKNKIRLQWIKAHAGHTGNELADQAAVAGSHGSGSAINITVPKTKHNKEIKLLIREEWTKRWQSDTANFKETRDFYPEPTNKMVKFLSSSNRKTIGYMIAATTGHCNLNYHVAKTKEDHDPLCAWCEEEDERPRHFFLDCPVPIMLNKRAEFFNERLPLQIPLWMPHQLLAFLRETGVWERLKQTG